MVILRTHLFSGALHDLHWDGVDLVVHLHRAPLAAADLHQQNSEVGAAQI